MKKFTAYSLLVSLITLLGVFLFTLTSWSTIHSSNLPGNPVNNPEVATIPVTPALGNLPLAVPVEAVKPLETLQNQELQNKLETILNYFGTDSHKTTPWETYEKKFSNNQR